MSKIKLIIKTLLYLLMVVVSIPMVILLALACIVMYGALKVEQWVIMDIWNEELTDSWNKMIGLLTEMIDSFKDLFRTEMEL